MNTLSYHIRALADAHASSRVISRDSKAWMKLDTHGQCHETIRSVHLQLQERKLVKHFQDHSSQLKSDINFTQSWKPHSSKTL